MLTFKMTLLKFHLYFSNNISTRPTKYRESEKFELVAREIQGLSTVVSTLVLPTCIKDEVVVNELQTTLWVVPLRKVCLFGIYSSIYSTVLCL